MTNRISDEWQHLEDLGIESCMYSDPDDSSYWDIKRAEMKEVIHEYPNLSTAGLYSKPPRYTSEDLLSEDSIYQFANCIEWLKDVKEIKTFNKLHHSYHLKHVIEKCANRYIYNGVCIAAAISLGFNVKEIEVGSLNAFFNMSAKSINKLKKANGIEGWL